jgi:hypothetical protein
LYKVEVAFKQAANTDVYGLDDPAYRDYSRARLARARQTGNSSAKKWMDMFVAVVLFGAAVFVILYHMGEIPQL